MHSSTFHNSSGICFHIFEKSGYFHLPFSLFVYRFLIHELIYARSEPKQLGEALHLLRCRRWFWCRYRLHSRSWIWLWFWLWIWLWFWLWFWLGAGSDTSGAAFRGVPLLLQWSAHAVPHSRCLPAR